MFRFFVLIAVLSVSFTATPSGAAPIRFDFVATFDGDDCTTPIEDDEFACFGLDTFADLEIGEQAPGTLVVETDPASSDFGFPEQCEIFGRNCPYDTLGFGFFDQTGPGSYDVTFGGDAIWFFLFDGATGSAEFINGDPIDDYSAVFTLSDVRVNGAGAPAPVPLPASMLLLLSALVGLARISGGRLRG